MIKLPIALDLNTNELIHISNINKENKESFNLVCPECKTTLVTKIGNINVHHFAHKNLECEVNPETMTHILAKKVIAENNEIVLPVYNPISLNWQHIKQEYTLNSVESKYEDIIPDVIININNRPIFIEVAYSHFIDNEKLEKLKIINIETWEIDLRKIDIFDYDNFKNILLNEIYNKQSIIIDYNNYSKYLMDELKILKQSNLFYNELLNQYKKIKDEVFIKTKKFPLLNGDNYLRLVDMKDNKEYWLIINALHRDMLSYFFVNAYNLSGKNMKYKSFIEYSIGKNKYYYQSGGFISEGLNIHWDLEKLLNGNRVNLKSNIKNDKFMLFSAIQVITPPVNKKQEGAK